MWASAPTDLSDKLQFRNKKGRVKHAPLAYRGNCLILLNRRGYWAGVGETFRSTITA